MTRVTLFSGCLVTAVLLTAAGCSRDADTPPKQKPAGLGFQTLAIDGFAFLVPTDQDAKGVTAERALEEMQKGMADDPETLALWQRLNAGLPVELRIIEPPDEVNSEKEAILTPISAQKKLMEKLQVNPSPRKAVALAICVYRPRPVKVAKLPALQFNFASGFSINLADLRKAEVGESVHYWGWDVRLLQKDYLLRKVPGWYIHEGKGASWDSNLTAPVDARAECAKLDELIAQQEKTTQQALEKIKAQFTPK